jgi:hypothetical protein
MKAGADRFTHPDILCGTGGGTNANEPTVIDSVPGPTIAQPTRSQKRVPPPVPQRMSEWVRPTRSQQRVLTRAVIGPLCTAICEGTY